jgi:hypothetical protein
MLLLLSSLAALWALGRLRWRSRSRRRHEAAAHGAAPLGPGAAERLVLDLLLNRQDRYALRLTCKALRTDVGARTTTLVLCEDWSSGAERLDVAADLAAADLARAFPGARALVLCSTQCSSLHRDDLAEFWAARFAPFLERNLGVLAQQLEHLDLEAAPQLTASALRSIAQLTSLRSLGACAAYDLELLQPASWGALRALPQLTSLHVVVHTSNSDAHLQHIAAAAPQLQALSYKWGTYDWRALSEQGASSLASMTSLASLHLDVCGDIDDSSAPTVRALLALPRLTHLSLEVCGFSESTQAVPQLLEALGQLTGLASLALGGDGAQGMRLEHLAPLQRLTRLELEQDLGSAVDRRGGAALARLGALRALRARFSDPAAAAAAALGRLERAEVSFACPPPYSGRAGKTQLAGGSSLAIGGIRQLTAFDTSQVHALELDDTWSSFPDVRLYAGRLRVALCHSPQLRALRLAGDAVLHAEALRKVAACRQLTSLCLWLCMDRHSLPEHPVAGGLAALAQGCKRLERLTLRGVKRLSVDMLPALMQLPSLRLLRLLGCSEAVGQEECRALAGQLGLRELQVEVVVDDGSQRAVWMIKRLAERWREGA